MRAAMHEPRPLEQRSRMQKSRMELNGTLRGTEWPTRYPRMLQSPPYTQRNAFDRETKTHFQALVWYELDDESYIVLR